MNPGADEAELRIGKIQLRFLDRLDHRGHDPSVEIVERLISVRMASAVPGSALRRGCVDRCRHFRKCSARNSRRAGT